MKNKNIVITTEELLDNQETYDHIIIKTKFETQDLEDTSLISDEDQRIKHLYSLIDKSVSHLKEGGLLFVYGLPKILPFAGAYLEKYHEKNHNFLFKYWIAIEFNSEKYHVLKNSHLGLLMYLKTKSLVQTTPFNLNTKTVRIPYKNCLACKKHTKDWGGKKHLMNPLGTAYSDVWSDLDISIEDAHLLPEKIIQLIYQLVETDETRILIIEENKVKSKGNDQSKILQKSDYNNFSDVDSVIHGDSIEYMKQLKAKYPEGLFDLAFADPPYNLSKNYDKYDDTREDERYIDWCNEWLQGMYDILRPGGALFVLNIPKWAIHHSKFLSNKMNLQHWIVWDALSTPAGKLLPAHYALLYFTKPGGQITSNYDEFKYIDSRNYCLRYACIASRKTHGEDKKELISDIWKDVFRIKHKKDRDQHPCQLPVKLMNRIIEIFSNKGDLIYDPFGGAGTTAISAKLLDRHFVISEMDEAYVHIARENLVKIHHTDNGKIYRRESVNQKKNLVPKKTVELAYIYLCRSKNKVLSIDEVKSLSEEVYALIDKYNGNFKKLQNVCKRKFEAESLIKQ